MHVCRQGYGVFSIGCGEKVTPSWEAGKDLPMLAVWDWLVWTCFYICYN